MGPTIHPLPYLHNIGQPQVLSIAQSGFSELKKKLMFSTSPDEEHSWRVMSLRTGSDSGEYPSSSLVNHNSFCCQAQAMLTHT